MSEIEEILESKTLKKKLSSNSIVEHNDLDYIVWSDGGIDIYVSDPTGLKYYPRSEQRHICVDRITAKNPEIAGIVVISEQIGSICDLLKLTNIRCIRDYYLNDLDENIRKQKDGYENFAGKEVLNILDSLLRNSYLEYDEAIHLMRLASDIGFVKKNSFIRDSPIPEFVKNTNIKTLTDGLMQVHYEELRKSLLDEIEKKILSGA